MPAPEQWESYFDADGIMEYVGCRDLAGDVVEFGCGYGTFTLPTAQMIRGDVHALDIDPQMVRTTALRASQLGLTNVIASERDFVTDGSGRAPDSAKLALLFNILHIEEPSALLNEAFRILQPGGAIAIIHWNYDARTPRGPPLPIRPRPDQCRAWGEQAGFGWKRTDPLPASPWHWGMMMAKR